MRIKPHFTALALLTVSIVTGTVQAQQRPVTVRTAPASKAQSVLDQASADQKFTLIVFHKEDSAALRSMIETAKAGVAKRSEKAAITYVQVTDPAEQELVARFDVARSPMPLTMVVAHNGAITGVFSKQITDEGIDAAIVTPTMTRCMKSLQENKLVFVCVQTTEKPLMPMAVKNMQADPQFKDRIALVSLQLNDPEEKRFLTQMQIDPAKVSGVTAALLAPPGMLIGKYDSLATKEQIAAALHKAGQCCDDPNCKHNHAAPQATQPSKARRN
jgi:hypothetical protein